MKTKTKRNSQIALMAVGILFISTNLWAASCEIGAFLGNGNHTSPTSYEVQSFEDLVGQHLSTVQVFWAWNDGAFPGADLTSGIINHDGYNTQTSLQLTWEPWTRNPSEDPYSLSKIINGDYDSYITEFANDCYDYDAPIRLRFAHEMITPDGVDTWYPWQNKPVEYVQAWQHIYNIFENESANHAVDNVDFVWAPLGAVGDLQTFQAYYPGQDYVDWIGMGGHNAGEDGEPGFPYWQNFDDLFANLYNSVIDHPEVFGDKEMMIAEFSSAEDLTDPARKGEWVSRMFMALKDRYTKISAMYWFNVDKEYDWRVDSSEASLAAFQYWLADEYFTSHVVPEPSSMILFFTGIAYIAANFKKNNLRKGGNTLNKKLLALLIVLIMVSTLVIPAAVKAVEEFTSFGVYLDRGSRSNHYCPSGYMGDYGDLQVNSAASNDPYSGKTCLKFTYTAEGKQGANWAGIYWQWPPNNWGEKSGGFDLTGATKLTFWAKGEKGGEQIIEFKMGGLTGTYSDTDSNSIGPVELSTEWKQYTIDLTDLDMSYISGGFAWVTNSMANPNGCTFYLDDIKYE
ncbi:MAG: glycosyl hydrolase [Candidatus Omnitrophota bacterium]